MIRVTAAQRHDLQGNPNQFYVEYENGVLYISTLFDLQYPTMAAFTDQLRDMANALDHAEARRVNRSQELEA